MNSRGFNVHKNNQLVGNRTSAHSVRGATLLPAKVGKILRQAPARTQCALGLQARARPSSIFTDFVFGARGSIPEAWVRNSLHRVPSLISSAVSCGGTGSLCRYGQLGRALASEAGGSSAENISPALDQNSCQ